MEKNMMLTSTKPYLLRALYDWIIDNECTPFVIINAEAPNVEVPKLYIEEGRIILNVSAGAVRDLKITNESLEFNARFNGVSTNVYAPISAVLAVYAQENGHGMVFNEDNHSHSEQHAPVLKKPIKRPDPSEKPALHVVKPSKSQSESNRA